jgi:hypothetical protein
MTDLKNLKKIKSFDIEEFDGVKSKIADVLLLDVEVKNFGDGDKEIRQLKIITERLNAEGEPLIATEFVALKKDLDTNEWGIPDNTDAKAMKFLNYFKVGDFDELKGKECRVVKRVKNDKSFLGIHYG